MTILNNIKQSIFSPKFYQGLTQKPFSFSIKYFYSLVLILAFILTIIISINLVPGLSLLFNNLSTAAVKSFPDNLIITIKAGKASTNVLEPFFVKMPNDFKAENQKNKEVSSPENFLVIDTKTSFSIDRFKEYKTLFWLTGDSIVGYDDGGIRIMSLEQIPDVVVDKPIFVSFVDKIKPIMKIIPPLAVLGIFAFLIAGFSFKLVHLLILALIILLIAKIKGVVSSYKNSYRIGIHAMTLGLVYYALTLILPISVLFLFSFLVLIVVWLNLLPQKKLDEVAENPPVELPSNPQ
ncbi:MAG: DUF1189 family protein [Patescibacteria group bacterium]|nr:DUF1189 family protein [Patescibacteria group bacterium]